MNESRAPVNPDQEQEQRICAYLAAHPDFFARHEQLLPGLSIPHPTTGKTVSLLERQVELLREQKRDLKRKLQHLTDVARGNEQLLQQLQRLVLELIDSPSAQAAVAVLESALRRDFQADAVGLWLFAEGLPNATGRDDPDFAPLRSIVDGGRPICGVLRREQAVCLFGENGAAVTSGAFIPLCDTDGKECLGLLGIGSLDPKRYHAEMGTVFLSHLAALIARVLRARLAG